MRHRLTLLLLLALAGCGGSSGAATTHHATPLSLTLDWYANADHVGVYAGVDRGFFARAGLDVTPRPPSATSDSITLVATGRTDLGISYEPEVFFAQQRHIPVVAVASVVPRALASIIAEGGSGIHTPADLRGKTIGVDGTGSTTAFVDTVLRHAGVDPAGVRLTNVGFNQVPDLLQHQVDAVAGVFQNIEGIQFASAACTRSCSRTTATACPHTTSSCWWQTPAGCAPTPPTSGRWAGSCRPSGRPPAGRRHTRWQQWR